MVNLRRIMIYLVLLFTLFPSLVWAGGLNVPTIFLTERLMLYSFVLIVCLEAWVIYKYFLGIDKKRSLIISLKANLLTMFIVVPIIWGVWNAILFNVHWFERFINQNFEISKFSFNLITAPWIDATQNLLIAEWIMAPVYFIASYYAEYWFSCKKLQDYPQSQVKKAFFFANLYSYLMIMFFETIYQFGLDYYKTLHPEKWYLW